MSRTSFTIWAAMFYKYISMGGYILRYRSHEMATALEAKIRDAGGRIAFNTRVDKIIVKGGAVAGVETSHGERIATEQVIANVSPTEVYNRLINPREEVPPVAYQNVNARKHGLSGFVVFLGLNQPPEKLGLKDYGYFVYDNTANPDILNQKFSDLYGNRIQAAICLNNATGSQTAQAHQPGAGAAGGI